MKWYRLLSVKQKVAMYSIIVLCFSIFVYFLYQFFSSPNTFANSNNNVIPWDGVSVSTNFFGGNGSEENPYQIKTASDFIYFQQLLNDNVEYQKKSYVLVNDIDLGNFNINMISFFEGSLNGQGHTISNFKIVSDKTESGLFIKLQNSTISDINLKNYSLINSSEESIAGGLASQVESSNLKNISFHDVSFSMEKNSISGILAGNIKNSNVNQVISLSNYSLIGNINDNKVKSKIILPDKNYFDN